MQVTIYAVGGDYAEQLVGVAHDVTTALTLVKFLRYTGAHSCVVRGSLGYGSEPLSGELGLGTLETMLRDALAA